MQDNGSLEDWIKRLTEEELPALSQTAQEIAKIADDDQSHLSRLSDIILRDPAMTMHVLRLTDSAYHIPRKNRQNTITRALVMLGVNEVKSICLSVAVFDPLLKKGVHRELTQEMARAFHAAVQARYLAVTTGDRASEEVFIATLLFHLGEMIFWCFGGKTVEALRSELSTPGTSKEEAERRVLGFELRQLTAELGRKWGLGKLLEEAVSGGGDDVRLKAVRTSHRFVAALEKGWGSPEARAAIDEIAALSGLPHDSLIQALHKNTEDAVQVAESFGAPRIGDTIAALNAIVAPAASADSDSGTVPVVYEIMEPDPAYQLEVLRALAELIMKGATVGSVLELILDGIYRGIGMDRALFALLSPNRKYLRAKISVGQNCEELSKRFKVELLPNGSTIFEDIIQHQDVRWIRDPAADEFRPLLPERVTAVLGSSPFFIAPTVVDNQAIGLFYADRSPTGRALDQASFDGFRQFALQANLALEYLGKY